MPTRFGRALVALPPTMRFGLAIAAFGALIDLVYHFGSATSGVEHDGVATTGHVVVLVGMLVTMVGLMATARRSALAKRRTDKGENR